MTLLEWTSLLAGLFLTIFGATAGAALLAVSRAELVRAVSGRLRGGAEPEEGLADVDERLTAASAVTSLGVVMIAATLPAVVAHGGLLGGLVGLALLAVPLILTAGYFVPRWLTRTSAESVLARVEQPLAGLSQALRLLLPAREEGMTPDFRGVWREGLAVVPERDEDLARAGGVLAFDATPVRTVMTPRIDVVAVAEDATPREIADTFAQSGFSRLPVYRGTLDEIVGMLHAFDLFKLRPGQPLPVRAVAVAPASRTCGALLLDMQRERRHLAIILDEFGGTLGIVTMEDLLERLVGEIDDEDEATPATPAPAGTVTFLEAEADTTLEAVAEHFGVELPRDGVNTLAGLVAERAGRIPAPGERFEVAGLEVTVLAATAARVERLAVRRATPPDAEDPTP